MLAVPVKQPKPTGPGSVQCRAERTCVAANRFPMGGSPTHPWPVWSEMVWNSEQCLGSAIPLSPGGCAGFARGVAAPVHRGMKDGCLSAQRRDRSRRHPSRRRHESRCVAAGGALGWWQDIDDGDPLNARPRRFSPNGVWTGGTHLGADTIPQAGRLPSDAPSRSRKNTPAAFVQRPAITPWPFRVGSP